jgi:hypothetical protein
MDSSQVAYCSTDDVVSRIFAGMSAGTRPPDAARDAILGDIILGCSRRFERETGRTLNGYAPIYELRLFSGRGAQHMDLDEFTALRILEFNRNIVGSPSWTDITADLTNGRIAYKPIRFWPKRRLFRQETFVTDPYATGNYRFTGIWGCVQPDLGLSPPTGQATAWSGLTDPQIQALSPNPSGPAYGWWQTPKDVQAAIAEWALYSYHSNRSGKGDKAGRVGASQGTWSLDAPDSVKDVIKNYRGATAKLALIGLDGSDAREEAIAGAMTGEHRWAGWHGYDPTGAHPENTW